MSFLIQIYLIEAFPLFKAGCAVVTIPESVVIGIVGSWLGNITAPLLIWLRVDDAVGATCVHGKHPSLRPAHASHQRVIPGKQCSGG